MKKRFCLILGTRKGFHKGESHFNFISEKLNVKPQQMVFVGDGLFDMIIDKESGCITIGWLDLIDSETIKVAREDEIVTNLKELPPLLKGYK